MVDQQRPHKKPGMTSKPSIGKPGKPLKAMVFWIILVLILLIAFQMFESGKKREFRIAYSTFNAEIEKGNIKSVVIRGLQVTGVLLERTAIPMEPSADQGQRREVIVENFITTLPAVDPELSGRIMEKSEGVIIVGEEGGSSTWVKILTSGLPLLLIVGLWFLIMRQMQAGGNKAFSFGKSRARMFGGDQPRTSFDDVAGADEAKEDLEEIIEFLKDPKKFQKLGGRIPKGALLLGPPGTGKTLLARAVAGEASVPFFSMSGSDFVEMFVGVGASRVRDLFEQGKKHAPCILFIDEIDAVGRHRGAGLGGGHDEREQTLNQLLVEMDGFENNAGVILLAATNRPDVLDPALLRPGRFDRRIMVDMPDVRGREGILKVHTKNIPLHEDVNLDVVARATPGMSGADLANLVNEAALLAARYNRDKVTMAEIEESKDRILLGPQKKSKLVKEEARELTAYHEAGHTIVGANLKYSDPVYKVSIIPRGNAGGVTFFLPEDDRTEVSREWCRDTIAQSLGGRVAEQLVLNRMGSGAQSDIEMASKLVRKMVTQWGMSDELGPISFGERSEQIFLGREIQQHHVHSEATAETIDSEIKRIVSECYERAEKILKENLDVLHATAKALLERETLDKIEIELLMDGKELPPLTTRRASSKKPKEKEIVSEAEESKEVRPDFQKQPLPHPDTT